MYGFLAKSSVTPLNILRLLIRLVIVFFSECNHFSKPEKREIIELIEANCVSKAEIIELITDKQKCGNGYAGKNCNLPCPVNKAQQGFHIIDGTCVK